jgi:recombination protein RecT
MSVKAAPSGEVIRAPQTPGAPTLANFISNHTKDFGMVLPKHMTADRMTRLAISAIRTTAHLAECTIPSFASALMACSVLGLEPNTPLGHAYLIPFKNNKRGGIYECQLIVGYKGLIELMYRSGIVASVKATPVFAGDDFEYEFGLHPDIRHKPSEDPGRGSDVTKLTHVYPVVQLREKELDPIWDVLTRAEIELRRKRSKASSDGPWVTDYVSMANKTGIRKIATWVPSSAERMSGVITAVGYENAIDGGRHERAVTLLGERAQETLEAMGAFPTADDEGDDNKVELIDRATGKTETMDRTTGEVT